MGLNEDSGVSPRRARARCNNLGVNELQTQVGELARPGDGEVKRGFNPAVEQRSRLAPNPA